MNRTDITDYFAVTNYDEIEYQDKFLNDKPYFSEIGKITK